MHRDLFAALDRGDADAAREFVASDRKGPGGLTTCFLVDRSGRPLRSVDATSTRELLARLAGDAKAAGTGFQTKITFESADCPSGDLSYAVLEFERTRIVDEKPETRHYRGTSLVRMEGSKWKLTHWHVSEARAAE
jgi:hypothetical protein